MNIQSANQGCIQTTWDTHGWVFPNHVIIMKFRTIILTNKSLVYSKSHDQICKGWYQLATQAKA